MVMSALEIRRCKNGDKHLRVAHCLLRRTELLWTRHASMRTIVSCGCWGVVPIFPSPSQFPHPHAQKLKELIQAPHPLTEIQKLVNLTIRQFLF